jgi:uncharacterized protein (TIGR02996 family)
MTGGDEVYRMKMTGWCEQDEETARFAEELRRAVEAGTASPAEKRDLRATACQRKSLPGLDARVLDRAAPRGSIVSTMPPAYPSVDESLDRLRRAGWSVGRAGFGPPHATVWQVSGTNGENAVLAHGGTLAEAYWRACQQARAAGALAADAEAAFWAQFDATPDAPAVRLVFADWLDDNARPPRPRPSAGRWRWASGRTTSSPGRGTASLDCATCARPPRPPCTASRCCPTPSSTASRAARTSSPWPASTGAGS